MRNNIDYGIDLGTTNSAIGRMEAEGNVKIIKSDGMNKDTTPSCVLIDRSGGISVGDSAYNGLNRARCRKLKNPIGETNDAFSEFKRMMGTDQILKSTHLKKDFTPVDLSAAVLKALKSYVKDENAINSAVITVPAKFKNPQNEATKEAARLAGFDHCILLQEPIAASIAYGFSGKSIEGKWVVFDFGGGTFDVALMEVEEGVIRVRDTEGDNLLGGKNLDDAIVNEILYPEVCQNFSVDSIEPKLFKDALKKSAEEVKIGFSNQDCHSFKIYNDELCDDDLGNEIVLDFEISFETYSKVVLPWYEKAIDIALDLVSRNNLSPSALEKVVLVGGPTFAHLFRSKIATAFQGTEIDVSIDPMTAVAVGASIFASTKKVPAEFQDVDFAKAQLEIECPDSSVEKEEPVAIVVKRDRTNGTLPEALFVQLANEDGSWTSSLCEMQRDSEVIMASLNPGVQNVFAINLFDQAGNRVHCQPERVTIFQGMKIANAPMAYSLGVALASERGSIYQGIEGLERNRPLPAKGKITVRTLQDINPLVDTLTFEFLQGEHADFDGASTEAFETLAKVTIEGKDIPSFMASGTQVDLSIKIDESSLISGEAFIPDLDETIEFKTKTKMEIPSLAHLRERANSAKNKLNSFEGLSEKSSFIEDEVEDLEGSLEKNQDEDARERAKQSLKEIWRKIDQLEGRLEWPKAEKELKEALEYLREVESEDGDRRQNLTAEFEKKFEEVKRRKDLNLAQDLQKEIYSACYECLKGKREFWVEIIESMQHDFTEIEWRNSTQARSALDQAVKNVKRGADCETLEESYRKIIALRKGIYDSGKSILGADIIKF